MILVTGGTGFIGKALIRTLVEAGYPVRVLIRPSKKSPRLPHGVKVNVAVASLQDERGLRAAMVDVDTVFHLVGIERQGIKENLLKVDVEGTRAIIHAAEDANVKKIFYLSHIGADRASAYPVFKAKAIAEEYIRKSKIPYTIFRTSIVFGKGDGFTTSIAQIIKAVPIIFFMPGKGDILIQPLWVEDLVKCLVWALENRDISNKMIELGGPEFLNYHEVVKLILGKLGTNRMMVSVSPPLLRMITVLIESLLPTAPVSVYWLDYLATNRTCSLDTIPRLLNLMPSRFSKRLDYLVGENWRRVLIQNIVKKS
ncbi:MAG TPA: NmrA family NAD(P)-binding protein [Anaerolineae bacterium]|nr:NmrA family NAD(P)-binding protein [Anaerolineae bacterium]